MAMTWFQQMFTPESSGSYQWKGRPDQGGGEFTGEQRDAQGNITYEGDAQDLSFVPRSMQQRLGFNSMGLSERGRGQMSTTSPGSVSNPLPGPQAQTGTGLTAKQDFMAGMDRLRDQTFDDDPSVFPGVGTGPMGDQDHGAMAAQPPGHMFTAGLTERQGVGYPTHLSAAVGPYTSGGQNQANLIGSNPDRAQMKIAEIRRQRALREHPSDNTFYEGSQGIGEEQGQAMMHALALQDDIMNANSNDAALLPRTGAQLPFGGPTADELDVYDVNSPGVGGQQTEPSAIAKIMKLLGGMMGGDRSGMFSPSQAGAGTPGPTVPSLMGPPRPPIMPGLSSTGSDSLARHYFRS
jgi:hypothetical protein